MIRSGGVEFHDDLKDVLYPIGSVQPHPGNYNNGDVEAIVASIRDVGMVNPVIAQKSTGYVLSGNHTWLACKELQAEVIPVTWLDCDTTTATKVMIYMNVTAARADPDKAQLVALIDQIHASGSEVKVLDTRDIEALRHLAEMENTYDEYATWPTLQFTVHPKLVQVFRHLTREADTDRDRFELLLRFAGWDGS